MFYLDRIKFVGRTIERQFSITLGWTKEIISKRLHEKRQAETYEMWSLEALLEVLRLKHQASKQIDKI